MFPWLQPLIVGILIERFNVHTLSCEIRDKSTVATRNHEKEVS